MMAGNGLMIKRQGGRTRRLQISDWNTATRARRIIQRKVGQGDDRMEAEEHPDLADWLEILSAC